MLSTLPSFSAAFGAASGSVAIELPEHGTLVFVGDSITWQSHYVAFVDAYLTRALPARSLRVINRGVRGDTARDVLSRLERDVVPRDASVIFIMLGINDGGLRGRSGRLLEAYERNMERLVDALRARTRAQIVLLTSLGGEGGALKQPRVGPGESWSSRWRSRPCR